MPAVEVSDLVVRYGSGLTAVAGLSFSAEAGEVLAILGPNGAGKTTTIETLEGYRTPTSGRVRVLGLDPVADHDALVSRIGVMLQGGGVYPGIRPAEAVRLFAAYYAGSHHAAFHDAASHHAASHDAASHHAASHDAGSHRAASHGRPQDPAAVLDRVGLGRVANTPWRRLSGGERQRLSLALALLGRPEVVFLDEPTAGIDVEGRQLVRQVVRDLREEGVCVLLATHELVEAERTADRVIIVAAGRVVASGTLAELAAGQGPAALSFRVPAGLDVAALGAALGRRIDEVEPGDYRVTGPTSPAMVAHLATWLADHDLALSDLHSGQASLEEVFLALTGEGLVGDALVGEMV
ncbi:MAG: ABC transporter ATP-binding protein [Acidimicrobiales bacterium]